MKMAFRFFTGLAIIVFLGLSFWNKTLNKEHTAAIMLYQEELNSQYADVDMSPFSS